MMQFIFYGFEMVEDMIFWKYYNEYFSVVFIVEGEYKNVFKDMMVFIVVKYQGFMYFILFLVSKYIDFDIFYGVIVLCNNFFISLDFIWE